MITKRIITCFNPTAPAPNRKNKTIIRLSRLCISLKSYILNKFHEMPSFYYRSPPPFMYNDERPQTGDANIEIPIKRIKKTIPRIQSSPPSAQTICGIEPNACPYQASAINTTGMCLGP
ncbi:hypothetical protein CDAR_516021 [Caerostris darwini]|uniref:Uncharacterized protein n=1 Tax=Caerostris darwini TaxID=1538125 RepID=A0AAV4NGH6_9ARAC|nr:hypothetical protein CDAR_516021 [Caerostris darwini]